MKFLEMLVVGSIVGCGSSPSGEAVIDPSLLGAPCQNIAAVDGKILGFGPVMECAGGAGVCVADGTRKVDNGGSSLFDRYCSASCENATCPEAWECVNNDYVNAENTQVPRICVKQPAVCGDGVKQLDEACDDSNKLDKDGCSADCRTRLPAGINVTSFHGFNLVGTQQSLSVTKAFYITAFPDFSDGSGTDGYANILDLTSTSIKVVVGARNAMNSYFVTASVPRTVGSIAPLVSTGQWDSVMGPALASSTGEVVSATGDGRAFEVALHFEGTASGSQEFVMDTRFVVTMP